MISFYEFRQQGQSQQGFILVAALVFLVILSLIGILAINNSSFERLLVGNEKLKNVSFYEADSGIAATIGLLESNIELKGFSVGEKGATRGIGFDNGIDAEPAFYMTADTSLTNFFTANFIAGNGYTNATDQTQLGRFFGQYAVDGPYRNAFWPRNPTGGIAGQRPTTSLKVDVASTSFASGSNIQSNEGYHGLGSGLASGGAVKIYDMRSRNDNINNAASQVYIQWRHVIK